MVREFLILRIKEWPPNLAMYVVNKKNVYASFLQALRFNKTLTKVWRKLKEGEAKERTLSVIN